MNLSRFISLSALPLVALLIAQPPSLHAEILPEGGNESVTSLIQKLKSSDIDQREKAAIALGKLGPAAAPAVPALRSALNDDFPYFRIHCVEALAKIGAPAIPAFIEALQNSQTDVRSVAAGALAEMGPAAASAVPALVKSLNDSDSTIRNRASTALERIGGASVEPVAARLNDPDPAFRLRVVRILGSLEIPSSVISELILRLEDEDAQVRLGAMKALTRKGSAAVQPLIGTLGSSTYSLRARAAEVLGDISREADAAVPSLITALQDEDATVRLSAARALGKIGPAAVTAVPALGELAKDTDPKVAAAGAEAISKLTSNRKHEALKPTDIALTEEPLPVEKMTPTRTVKRPTQAAKPGVKRLSVAQHIAQLGSSNPAMRSSSEASLVAVGPSAIPALIKGLNDPNVKVVEGCSRVLGALGPAAESASVALSEMIRGPNVGSRDEAFHALMSINSATAIAALGGAAKEPDPQLRLWVAQRFEELGSSAVSAVPYLTEMLNDSVVAVSTTAASALTKIGGETAKTALESFQKKQTSLAVAGHLKDLRNTEAAGKTAAVAGLVKIGSPAITSLIQALRDPNRDVKAGSAKALGQIGGEARSAVPALVDLLEDKETVVRHEAATALEKINDPSTKRTLQFFRIKEKVRQHWPF